MLREALNASQLARNCSDLANLVVPKIYWGTQMTLFWSLKELKE